MKKDEDRAVRMKDGMPLIVEKSTNKSRFSSYIFLSPSVHKASIGLRDFAFQCYIKAKANYFAIQFLRRAMV